MEAARCPIHAFVEVFSGPNAPLSCALARAWGVRPPVPPGTVKPPGPEQSELPDGRLEPQATTSLSTSATSALGDPGITLVTTPTAETVQPRAQAVEAAKQPSFGKRQQLIPNGLNDAAAHFKQACKLQHPFSSMATLKADHQESLCALEENPSTLVRYRLEQLARVRKLKSELTAEQRRANASAAWTARKLSIRPNTCLMERLQSLLHIEDTDVPQLCLDGMRITGKAQTSPFFMPFEVRPVMSRDTFLNGCRERSLAMIERVRHMAQKGPPEMAKAIWEKTQREVEAGTMGPAITLDQARAKYGSEVQVTPSFGLAQGTKFRRIDDHTASGVNQMAHRLQKVPMTMVDYIGVMLKALASQSTSIRLATEDMKSAYRQIALHPADVRFAITGVYNPETDEVSLHEMYGQPFGAGHSVPNFCRVAEWISRCSVRLFHTFSDHFFDDFFCLEPSQTIESALFCLKALFTELGFQLDPDKSQVPSHTCAILGIMFSTQCLAAECKISLEAKPSRVANLCETIRQVLTTGQLSAALAASIVGKFGFLCSTLFGKVGRCCTGPLRKRQYSQHKFQGLTPDIKWSLHMMLAFLKYCPSRELALTDTSPVVLYTDASDVPGRQPQRLVGAVLFIPDSHQLLYSAEEVPHTMVQSWRPRKSYMGQLELVAPLWALELWSQQLQERSVLLFVDNDSAATNLVKGYSPQPDSSHLVGSFWLTATQLKLHIYIDHVESKSNIADGPSRNSFAEVIRLGGTWTPPKTGTLGGPATLSPFQLAHWNTGGKFRER